jgi:hypothetical protein
MIDRVAAVGRTNGNGKWKMENGGNGLRETYFLR